MPAGVDRPGPDSRYLTVDEAARLLSLHPMTIRSMINRKIIPSCRLGRAIRVDAKKLEAMLEAQMDGQGQGKRMDVKCTDKPRAGRGIGRIHDAKAAKEAR